MAALPAGVQYGLSSESSYKENKELVFVKLTDSALKAIQDFLRNNRDRLAKPKIQFLPGNEGKISIPAVSSGNGPAGEATFHFSINNNAEMEGPQGSFECVRSGGARRLESCGPLPRRMRVQANDDSYEATKDRMARTVAAEQSKCTRVIKPNQTDIGRRVKVRATHPYSAPGVAQIAERLERAERNERPERIERSDRPERVERPERTERPERIERPERQERIERPERPERIERPERQERIERPERQERIERPDRPERAERVERPVPTAARPQPPPPVHQPQPMPHHNQHLPQRPPPNPDLTRRSLKERLIQLLALKPFKKPELYARLMTEGIKEKERNVVSKILPQISSIKDNCYHLRRHIWNDVNEDWPFYTEEEKRMLKRRKPQNLTPPLSSDSANSLSPRASPSASKRAGSAGNMPGIIPEEAPAAKKQRISHYRRPSPPSSGYATTSSGERHASDNEDERTTVNPKKDNGYTLNFTTVKELCASPVKNGVTNGYRNSPPVEQTSITEKDITNTEPLENTELTSVPEENNMTDLDEIERLYPPITSSNMRRAYKNEFADLYTEYRNVYARVAKVASLFTRLENELKRAPPSSPHHQSIEQQIVEEYRRVNNDTEYQKARQRVNYLHRKLTHIKRMVHQYDQPRNLKPDRVCEASTTQAY